MDTMTRETYQIKFSAIVFLIAAVFMFTVGIQNTARADFVIQAEDYDSGGEGFGYHDTDAVNNGGTTFTGGVDIEDCTDTGGGYNVGWIAAGEWLKYTLKITPAEAGYYTIQIRVASTTDAKSLRLLNKPQYGLNQIIPGSEITFNSTGGWQTWQTKNAGSLYLSEGNNTITMDSITGGFNVNYIRFIKMTDHKFQWRPDTTTTTYSSLLVSESDYNKVKKVDNVQNYINPLDKDVDTIGNVEEGDGKIRGWVWNMDDSSYSYMMDVQVLAANGTTVLGTLTDVVFASELNPTMTSAASIKIRDLITAMAFTEYADYHGFTISKKAILEHIKIKYSLDQGTVVNLRVLPKAIAGKTIATDLFKGTLFSGVIPPTPSYDSNVSVDWVDMSHFPLITVDFTTTHIAGIQAITGEGSEGAVYELTENNSGDGQLEGGVDTRPHTVGGPLDIVIVYENSNSMNSAAMTKIDNIITSLSAIGFSIRVEKIPFEVSATGNKGIWANAKAGLNSALNMLPMRPELNPEKWIVLVAGANGYLPLEADILYFINQFERKNMIFTCLHQPTGNEKGINEYFSEQEQHFRYYEQHLGVGLAGDAMENTAKLFLTADANIKKWRMTYRTGLLQQDGSERREQFSVKSSTGSLHGPAVAYYRAPNAGIGEQNIMLDLSLIKKPDGTPYNFDLLTATTPAYVNVKYIPEQSFDAILGFTTASDSRYLMPGYRVSTTSSTFNGLTGKTNKMMMNKSAAYVNATTSVEKMIIKDKDGVECEIYYPLRQIGDINDNIDTITYNFERGFHSIYPGASLNDRKLIFRLVKGTRATAIDYRYSPYVGLNPLKPCDVSGSAINTFLTSSAEKYIDFIYEASNNTWSHEASGVLISYDNVNHIFKMTGLPIGEAFTLQYYAVQDIVQYENKYRFCTMEDEEDMRVPPPVLDQGSNAKENDIFAIENINSIRFPVLEASFSTKTRFDVKVSSSSIYMKSGGYIPAAAMPASRPTSGSAAYMEEIMRDENGNVDAGKFLQAIALPNNSTIKENLDFTYPLDIVFCIDDSGSMANEIAAVANGMKNFVNILAGDPTSVDPVKKIGMGFNVKFSLILFGPNQYESLQGGFRPSSLGSVNYRDDNFLAEYQDNWYSNPTTGQNDITALKNILTTISTKVAGGYWRYQENGQMAIHYATERLKREPRSLSATRTILDNNSGVLPSKKWIIFLTDENMDNETVPDGCTTDTIMSDLAANMKISDNDLISLTGIFHTKKPAGTPGLAAAIDVDCGIPGGAGGTEVRPRPSSWPADTGGRYYGDFRAVLDDTRFNYYEMGGGGEWTESCLTEAAGDMGIIKKWKLEFTTPNNQKDGTYRDIYFDLRNVPDLNGVMANIPLLRDMTTVAAEANKSVRRYVAPIDHITVSAIAPNMATPLEKRKFTVVGNNLRITASVGAIGISPKKLEVWITKAGEMTEIPNTRTEVILENKYGTTYLSPNSWQRASVDIPKVALLNQGHLFDVYMKAYNVALESAEILVEDVKVPSAIRLSDIQIRNKTLEARWKTAWARGEGRAVVNVEADDATGSVFYALDGTLPKWKKYSWFIYPNSYVNTIFAGDEEITVTSLGLDKKDTAYEGEYCRKGDEIEISFTVEASIGSTSAAITVDMSNIGGSSLGVVTAVNGSTGKGQVLFTSNIGDWDSVAGSATKTLSIGIEVADSTGSTLSDRIPGVGVNKKFVIDTGKYYINQNLSVALKTSAATNFVMDKTKTLTETGQSDKYYTNTNTAISIDGPTGYNAGNDTRAVKVYYTYDYMYSDRLTTDNGFTAKDQVAIGTHSGDRYFYVEGVNDIDFKIDGIKDDGQYILYAVPIDRAGNEGTVIQLKNIAASEMYVDTKEPEITAKRAAKDSSGVVPAPVIIDSDNFRNGDRAHVEYTVQDAGIPDSLYKSSACFANVLGIVNNKLDYSTKTYANYSELVTTGHDPGVEVTAINSSAAKANIKIFSVKGGDYNTAGNEVAGTSSKVNPFVIFSDDGVKNVVVNARDLAGNIASTTIPFRVDNTAPVFDAVVYLAPVETINYNGNTVVDSFINYTNTAGAPATLTTTGIRTASSTTVLASTNTGIGYWSQELTNLNTLANNKSGTTAYSRFQDAFIGVEENGNSSGIDYYSVTYTDKNNIEKTIVVSKTIFDNAYFSSDEKGIFVPIDEIFKAGQGGASSAFIGQSANIRVTAWDLAGNSTMTTMQKNAMMYDSAINQYANSAISITGSNGNGVTLSLASDNSISINLNLTVISDSIGLQGYKVKSFKDERGNSVASTFEVGTNTYPIDTIVSSAAVAINAQVLNADTQGTVVPGAGIHTLKFYISSNASFVGGKVKLDIELVDHLGNKASITRDFLVQRGGINIKAQDTKSNKQITTELNMGEEGSIQRRIEGSRQ